MKSIVLLLALMTSSLVFSEATIVCKTGAGDYYLSAYDFDKVEDFASECQTNFIKGKICFYGSPSEVAELIFGLIRATNILSEEGYLLDHVSYDTTDHKKLSYTISSNTDLINNEIKTCN